MVPNRGNRALRQIKSARFTRYPVRDPSVDRFVGLLHIKDLLTSEERLRDINDLRPYVRKLARVVELAPLASPPHPGGSSPAL